MIWGSLHGCWKWRWFFCLTGRWLSDIKASSPQWSPCQVEDPRGPCWGYYYSWSLLMMLDFLGKSIMLENYLQVEGIRSWQMKLSQPNSTSTQLSWEWQGNELDHPPHPRQTFRALPGNLGSWFSVCNLILTQKKSNPKDFWTKIFFWPKIVGARKRFPWKKVPLFFYWEHFPF